MRIYYMLVYRNLSICFLPGFPYPQGFKFTSIKAECSTKCFYGLRYIFFNSQYKFHKSSDYTTISHYTFYNSPVLLLLVHTTEWYSCHIVQANSILVQLLCGILKESYMKFVNLIFV